MMSYINCKACHTVPDMLSMNSSDAYTLALEFKVDNMSVVSLGASYAVLHPCTLHTQMNDDNCTVVLVVEPRLHQCSSCLSLAHGLAALAVAR